MEGKRVPEEWIGRRVKVGIRTPKGGRYWTLGWLQGVTDDEICISATDPLGKKSPTPKSYPWSSVEDVQPLHGPLGRTTGDLGVRSKTGAPVLAVVRGDEEIPNPKAGLRPESGDAVGVLGKLKQRATFDAIAGASTREPGGALAVERREPADQGTGLLRDGDKPRGREDRIEKERRETRRELRAEGQVRMLFGRSSAVLGIVVALIGGLAAGDAGPTGYVGLVLGALGCVLGARWLGTAAVALSATKILLGLAGG